MSETNDIGQKIKVFRIRAGMSQLELELAIGAAQGSISRIESGKVDPSKETILKIIEELSLSPKDAADLFSIDTGDRWFELAKVTRSLNENLELIKVLQSSVNEIIYELDLLAGFITLVRGGQLFAYTATQNWATELSLKIISKPFDSLHVSMSDPNNLMVKAIKNHIPYFGDQLRDFTVPAIPRTMADIIHRVVKMGPAVALPIVVDSDAIGAIMVAHHKGTQFGKEYEVLQVYAEHVGIAISNALKYQKLQEEIKLMKQSHS